MGGSGCCGGKSGRHGRLAGELELPFESAPSEVPSCSGSAVFWESPAGSELFIFGFHFRLRSSDAELEFPLSFTRSPVTWVVVALCTRLCWLWRCTLAARSVTLFTIVLKYTA